MNIMPHRLWAALVSLVLLWPSAAMAGDSDGTTAHVRELTDGTQQAIFKVEIWSKEGVIETWRLLVDRQNCTVTPFDDPPPVLEGVLQQDVHATVLWTPL